MGKYTKIPRLFGLCMVIGMLAGCMGHSPIVTTPSWYRLESGLYNASEGKVFYGIGQADGVRNPTLLRATADNRARKELAGVLEGYVAELSRSQRLASEPAWMALSLDERRQILGMLVHKSLQRAVVSEHWSDTQHPRLLSLCRLDIATFRQVLSGVSFLDKKTRAAIGAEAETVHARLSK